MSKWDAEEEFVNRMFWLREKNSQMAKIDVLINKHIWDWFMMTVDGFDDFAYKSAIWNKPVMVKKYLREIINKYLWPEMAYSLDLTNYDSWEAVVKAVLDMLESQKIIITKQWIKYDDMVKEISEFSEWLPKYIIDKEISKLKKRRENAKNLMLDGEIEVSEFKTRRIYT
jgi:hypothetical protein